MGPNRDYYEVLGVHRDASPDEVKRAYRKVAVEHHPDRNPDDPGAEERFKEASEAYSVLGDADKRRRYDRLGHSAFRSSSGAGSYERVDFSSVAEILEGFLGDVFGRRRRGQTGGDIEHELRISFVEAALGSEKTVRITRPTLCRSCTGTGAAPGTKPVTCPACDGRGAVRYQRGFFAANRPCQSCRGTGQRVDKPCTECDGHGVVSQDEELSVKVPAGVEDGAVRTVRGAGEQAPAGNGDLHLLIRVEPHPIFTRDGADVLCTVPVSFPQAVLGAQFEVPTLDGKVTLKLPAGTQSGRVLRLRGKGIVVFGGAGKGDQLVRILVEVPEKISRKQRKLIEDLAQEMGTDTHPQQQSFLEKLRALFG